MMINGRLLLLIAATGLFIRVWSANDRAHRWDRPRTTSARMTVSSPSLCLASTAAQTVVCRPQSTAASALEEFWSAGTCPIPLPAELQGGVYRVIDDTGRVARLEIASTGTQTTDAESTARCSADFCVVTGGTRRWYFVRLQSPDGRKPLANSPVVAHDASKDATAQGRPSPCSNRKFDFTGYATTKPLADEWENYISLPDPSDLPGLR